MPFMSPSFRRFRAFDSIALLRPVRLSGREAWFSVAFPAARFTESSCPETPRAGSNGRVALQLPANGGGIL
jgi:hypothetical protein